MFLLVFPLSTQYQNIFEKRVVETLDRVSSCRNQDSIYVTSEMRFEIEVQSKKNIVIFMVNGTCSFYIYKGINP